MSDAELVLHFKKRLPDGSIVEMILWRLSRPIAGSAHRFKYRLYFGKGGMRIVGYDNERGKGDHRHRRGVERPYRFSTPEQLIEDFLADVRREGGTDE